MDAFAKLSTKQKQTAGKLSNYRLITFLLGFTTAVFLYLSVSHALGIVAGVLTLTGFIYLAQKHHRVREQQQYTEALKELNARGSKRLQGEWVQFEDKGEEFEDKTHPYALDLDLLGQASLFQWFSSAHTPIGRNILSARLKDPDKSREKILLRQEAIAELGKSLGWRQRFEAEGMIRAKEFQVVEPFLEWAKDRDSAYLRPILKLAVTLVPMITCILSILYLGWKAVPWQVPTILLVGQFLFLQVDKTERGKKLSLVYKQEAGLKTYAKLLYYIEKKEFQAPKLKELQQRLRDSEGKPACEQIKRLSRIVERISNRDNAMFIFLNILLLWDYHCLIALEQWKSKSGDLLKTWLEVIGEFEELASLANIAFENPEWAWPNIEDHVLPSPEDGESRNEALGTRGLTASQLGHPLLTRQRVTNDFTLREPSGIALITGSNMSGKSTFLRTVGCNLLLAYLGAPVCAKSFSCSIFSLWTCMRVNDNLEQSISSFYAEILRIKQIVEAAKEEEAVFFLLDEIFKGTNSQDRHQGAKALITQLQKEGAMGLVSTHDLELGELEKTSQGTIKNYHFREYYENKEIIFDYKLRAGLSTTRNALYLIRLAGIDV